MGVPTIPTNDCGGDHGRKAPTRPLEVRYLTRNLPSAIVFQKIREAERRMAAGERELGFYLLDLKRRCLYREKGGASDFRQFILLRTGLSIKKANQLVRVALALESLPRMDQAFARGELYWSAVRAMAVVATPQTEEHWVEFARNRRVDEVERKVAASKAGDDPRQRRHGVSPVRYPYRFNATPEVHQAIESLAGGSSP